MKRAGISLFDTHRVFCFICASDANATFSPVSTLASPSHGRGCPRSSMIPRCECGLPGLLVEFGRTYTRHHGIPPKSQPCYSTGEPILKYAGRLRLYGSW